MAISFDKAFGIHPQALVLRSERAEIISANIANADTPGFKAKDIDFTKALENAMGQARDMKSTNSGHFDISPSALNEEVLFRNPNQASLDGNTVETHIEQAKYAENSLKYQASLRFINGKISGVLSALKGE